MATFLATLANILADRRHPIWAPARYVLDPILPPHDDDLAS
jgi:hypothetical protein